jgi:immune inhibitor A
VRLLAAAAVASALLVGSPAAADVPDAWQTLQLVRQASPPVRDLPGLRARIGDSAAAGQLSPLSSAPGTLWVSDLVHHSYRPVPVDLAYTSEHAEWFVERGREPGDVVAAADFFEARTFPRVRELTGVDWAPGSNGQPPLGIFNGQTPGVAGYMSAGDAAPRSVFPFSNERLMVYLSLDALRPGSRSYNATLAHELEHLAHFVVNPSQEGWLDEGLAELVSNLVMEAGAPSLSAFRSRSDTQLTAWSEKPWEARAHYEASYLWSRYLLERGGGPAALSDLVHAGGQGLVTVDRFARARGIEGGVDRLFRDWLVANLLGDVGQADGRYGYQGLDQRSAPAGSIRLGDAAVDGQVHQFAANYYELSFDPPGELRIDVAPTVRLIPADDVHGAMFWSLRGDNLDTRLTRRFDLAGLDHASLRYRVWHDLELDYDFCYTLASLDGAFWEPLAARRMTDSDVVGSALGPGYTGSSDRLSTWLEDEVDLTPFAGRVIYVRFECVTDQSYSGPGFAIDELSIPELGFGDDAEADQGWTAEGFVRSPNLMAQPAAVLVVRVGPDRIAVREVPLGSDGRGRLNLDEPMSSSRWFAIVAGLAPVTLEPMSYRLSLVAAGS